MRRICRRIPCWLFRAVCPICKTMTRSTALCGAWYMKDHLADFRTIGFVGEDFSENPLRWQLMTELHRSLLDLNDDNMWANMPHDAWSGHSTLWCVETYGGLPPHRRRFPLHRLDFPARCPERESCWMQMPIADCHFSTAIHTKKQEHPIGMPALSIPFSMLKGGVRERFSFKKNPPSYFRPFVPRHSRAASARSIRIMSMRVPSMGSNLTP